MKISVVFTLMILFYVSPSALDAATWRICVDVDVDYSDNYGDYLLDDTNHPAAGQYLRVVRFAPPPVTVVFEGSLFSSGTYEGCTPKLSLSTAYWHSVFTESRTRVSGNYVRVLDHPNTTNLYRRMLDGAWIPGGGGTRRYTIDASRYPAFNVLTAATFALRNQDGGVDDTYRVFLANPDCSASCTRPNGDIQLNTTSYKNAVGHELGHAVMLRARGGVGWNQGCNGHDWTTREIQTCAAPEGFANWYSIQTFNDQSQPECTYDPPSENCSSVNYPYNLLETAFNPPYAGFGTEADWARALWWMVFYRVLTENEVVDTFACAADWTNGEFSAASDVRNCALSFANASTWDFFAWYHGIDN